MFNEKKKKSFNISVPPLNSNPLDDTNSDSMPLPGNTD